MISFITVIVSITAAWSFTGYRVFDEDIQVTASRLSIGRNGTEWLQSTHQSWDQQAATPFYIHAIKELGKHIFLSRSLNGVFSTTPPSTWFHNGLDLTQSELKQYQQCHRMSAALNLQLEHVLEIILALRGNGVPDLIQYWYPSANGQTIFNYFKLWNLTNVWEISFGIPLLDQYLPADLESRLNDVSPPVAQYALSFGTISFIDLFSDRIARSLVQVFYDEPEPHAWSESLVPYFFLQHVLDIITPSASMNRNAAIAAFRFVILFSKCDPNISGLQQQDHDDLADQAIRQLSEITYPNDFSRFLFSNLSSRIAAEFNQMAHQSMTAVASYNIAGISSSFWQLLSSSLVANPIFELSVAHNPRHAAQTILDSLSLFQLCSSVSSRLILPKSQTHITWLSDRPCNVKMYINSMTMLSTDHATQFTVFTLLNRLINMWMASGSFWQRLCFGVSTTIPLQSLFPLVSQFTDTGSPSNTSMIHKLWGGPLINFSFELSATLLVALILSYWFVHHHSWSCPYLQLDETYVSRLLSLSETFSDPHWTIFDFASMCMLVFKFSEIVNNHQRLLAYMNRIRNLTPSTITVDVIEAHLRLKRQRTGPITRDLMETDMALFMHMTNPDISVTDYIYRSIYSTGSIHDIRHNLQARGYSPIVVQSVCVPSAIETFDSFSAALVDAMSDRTAPTSLQDPDVS